MDRQTLALPRPIEPSKRRKGRRASGPTGAKAAVRAHRIRRRPRIADAPFRQPTSGHQRTRSDEVEEERCGCRHEEPRGGHAATDDGRAVVRAHPRRAVRAAAEGASRHSGAGRARRGHAPHAAGADEGEHRISCIPCGHVYGRSCLERWLTQRGTASATCPQCGRRFKHKDIINIYAPEVAVPNNDLEKQLWYCRQKLESLEEVVLKQGKLLDEIVAEKNHRSTDVGVSKRQRIAEHSDGRTYLEPSASASTASASSNSCRFVLLKELSFDGARVMGIDASNQIILASGKAPGVGGEHVLRKISMLSNHEARTIQLPPDTKVVKDICILPGGSALFASLGKRLSLFSMTSDSVVLQCNLPVPAWSCSAHDSDSHRVYAGLQDGRVLVFDTRQPSRPLHSMAGLSKHLVHTLHSITDNSGSRKVLSASAIGPCMWDADGNQSSPKLLLEDANQRVCFSLACAPLSSDLLVASYRPKADYSSGDTTAPSQPYLSQTLTQSGAGKLGQHTVIRRTGSASFAEGNTCHSNVSEVRMCKSAIVPCGNDEHLFLYGDESHRGILTWQLPSLGFHSGLRPHCQPILDLRYAGSPAGGGFLGCLSDDRLQVYRVDR